MLIPKIEDSDALTVTKSNERARNVPNFMIEVIILIQTILQVGKVQLMVFREKFSQCCFIFEQGPNTYTSLIEFAEFKIVLPFFSCKH